MKLYLREFLIEACRYKSFTKIHYTSPFTINEVKAIIKHLNPKKAPGYDLITNKVLQMLPKIAIKYITQLCNAVLRRRFFLPQWKVAQIQKPGKSAELAESYKLISLLSVLSKLFEKLLFSRINIIMKNYGWSSIISSASEINMQQ